MVNNTPRKKKDKKVILNIGVEPYVKRGITNLAEVYQQSVSEYANGVLKEHVEQVKDSPYSKENLMDIIKGLNEFRKTDAFNSKERIIEMFDWVDEMMNFHGEDKHCNDIDDSLLSLQFGLLHDLISRIDYVRRLPFDWGDEDTYDNVVPEEKELARLTKELLGITRSMSSEILKEAEKVFTESENKRTTDAGRPAKKSPQSEVVQNPNKNSGISNEK